MNDWRNVRLGELVAAAGGVIRIGPFGSQLHAHEYTLAPTGIPVVMPKNMANGRVDRRSVKRVDEKTAQRLRVHRLVPGDIVLARRGDVGRYAFIEADEADWLCGTGSVRIHVPDHSVILPRFLRHAIGSPGVADWLVSHAVGSTMPNLNSVIVADIPLRVPTLDTQRRVVAILDALAELIEINECRIELLEDLARSLYREWFVGFRFPRHEEALFVDSPLGRIPSGWDVVGLNQLVTTQYGFTTSAKEDPVGPRFLRGMDINKQSFIDWSTVPYAKALEDVVEKFRLEVGDVCVIRMADPGKVGIVERPVDAIFASYLVRLRSKEARLPPLLLFHHLDSSEYQSWIGGSSTGSTRKSASAAVLTEWPIALPPLEVAKAFEARSAAFRAELTCLVQTNALLGATRDLLLPRLVTGRLDISDVNLGALLPTEGE